MKKFLIMMLLVLSTSLVFSQHFEVFSIDEIEGGLLFCANNEDFLGVIVYGETDCPTQVWECTGGSVNQGVDSITLINTGEYQRYQIVYHGCNTDISFRVKFDEIHYYSYVTTNPFTESVIWKRSGESINLTIGNDPSLLFVINNNLINCDWSNGESGPEIIVNTPGIYSVTFSYECDSITHSVEVRDNVELYRATVDLRTNKNKVTWQVTPEQAEYITDVKIYRDDVLVGTAPYTDGYFLDAIGSDAAARNYRIVGVSVEGDDCPIPSYEKGTIHTTYYEDVDGNLNMTWNTPYVEEGAQGTLTGFQICKYNPATEEVTVIDQVNKLTTDYTCNSSAFIGGQATIAALFDSKDTESRSFSNRNTMLAVSENDDNYFKVYPNPANGRFTVEGIGMMHITNVLGQEIMAKEIDGKETVELPQGLYFVKLNGMTRKIVVE